MRYMILVKHYEDYGDAEAPPALYQAMGEFVGELEKNGTLIDGAGLQPLAKGTRVCLAGGDMIVTDGPFTETKEVVGGYAVIDVNTHAQAVALARKFMDLHRIHWPEFEGESELRQFEE